MLCTLSGVSGAVGLMRTIEHDRRAFLQVDCPSLSFDLARCGLHGPGFGARGGFQVAHDQQANPRVLLQRVGPATPGEQRRIGRVLAQLSARAGLGPDDTIQY
jgi:hypothetical protein